MATDTASDAQTYALLRTLVTALEDKKAMDLTVLHVGGISDITDYLVLATGNSEPHLRALRIEAEKVLDAAKVKIAGMDQGGFNSGWTVVDAYQIMAHFFTPEQRENYALEKLWKDAEPVDLSAPAPVKKAPAKAKKAAPAKKAAAGAKVAKAKPAKSAKGAKPSAAAKKPAAKKSAAAPKAKAPAKAKAKSAKK